MDKDKDKDHSYNLEYFKDIIYMQQLKLLQNITLFFIVNVLKIC